ncbi:uncharacterized protein LOC114519143 [Dendronephthya gigantea]|uniref:uncharacterized protein LOC114519143 n=1 Tax=Dendronephthya gigantea TaxID=151771 RepID=UPI00106D6A42|nr:uncharacterized protein LOC114519143 [Dendronephthya gigantea]
MSVHFSRPTTTEENITCTNISCIHGACESGSCVCEVKFSGNACKDPNLGYYIGFGIVFYLISFISLLQLVFCIRSELQRMARPQFWKACHVTIQKLLYLYVIVAAGSRGVYYTTEVTLPQQWRVDLFDVYYPFVICSFTALICFWAEAFHLSGWTAEKSQFLKKSSQFFIVFNLFIFTVTLAQIITTKTVKDSKTLMLLADVFSGCFVFLMFTVLLFFLIYGIEIFCKVEGAFKSGSNVINWTQLSMSRLGLVAQSIFQLSAAVFFLCDVLQRKWQYSTGVESRNALEIVARISELAVALWFPCVLWNCFSSKELWILNPKKLIKVPLIEQAVSEDETTVLLGGQKCYNTMNENQVKPNKYDCWVCYDADRQDAGAMIFPCKCKGDVAAVHQNCLKRWLMELSLDSNEVPRCRVCKTKYIIKEDKRCVPSGFKFRHYVQTFFIIAVMISVAVGTYRFCVDNESTLSKVGFVGIALLCECILFRWLGFSFVAAYQRVRLAAIIVIGRAVESSDSEY